MIDRLTAKRGRALSDPVCPNEVLTQSLKRLLSAQLRRSQSRSAMSAIRRLATFNRPPRTSANRPSLAKHSIDWRSCVVS